MMTFEEWQARAHSAETLSYELGKAAMTYFNAQCDLNAYDYGKVPSTIWQAAQVIKNRYWQSYCELNAASRAANEAADQIKARPFTWVCDDGDVIAVRGLLPNGEFTSEDEEKALQMYAAYKASKACEVPEPIELPF